MRLPADAARSLTALPWTSLVDRIPERADPRISYSRKVFIPLTRLCQDSCAYCTFAHHGGLPDGQSAYLTPDEVLEIARQGAEAGCTEALFTLGDRPEARWPAARDHLAEMGYDSTIGYLNAVVNVFSYWYHRLCRLVTSSMGILTDYTGIGWSMKSPAPEEFPSSVISELQFFSCLQLGVYIGIFSMYGNDLENLKALVFWWMAPCVIGYAPISLFRNAEHADCDRVTNQLHAARTVESNFIIRWLLWETNFHAEHHAYPMVPFFNLPVLHKLLDKHIKHNETKSFTVQNWHMLRRGGWIDKQNS